jgi:hypothetical protein
MYDSVQSLCLASEERKLQVLPTRPGGRVDLTDHSICDSACGPSRLVFNGGGDFMKTVRTRADAHFAGAKRRDDQRLYRKAIIIALWFLRFAFDG